MIRSFELEGAEVAYPFVVQMGGTIVEQIDGAVHTNGLSCLIECKDQVGNVNIDPIAKLITTCEWRELHEKCLHYHRQS